MDAEGASAFPKGIRTPSRAFKRLTVDTHFNMITHRRVLVEWALLKSFIGSTPGPYTFELQRGYSANDDGWVPIAQTVDQPWAYDTAPILPQKGMDVFYRVIMTDANGGEHISQSVHATTHWTRYDWSLAKEIIRKETMLLRRRTGTKGYLLKRRLWGEACDECIDPVTGERNTSDCSACGGVGILGGFYEPFEYWVAYNPSQRLQKLDTNQGLVTSTVETVRALAYPAPVSNDVWVNAATDQRYLVMGDVAAIARHRGINLVLNLRLDERARSESIYQVEVPCS